MTTLTLDGLRMFSPGWTSDTRCPRVFSESGAKCCSVVLLPIPICFLLQAEVEHLKLMFDKYIEKVINFKKSNCKELITITELNGVMSLCRLYDALATADNGVRRHLQRCSRDSSQTTNLSALLIISQINVSDTEHLGVMVELWFVFSLIWSICASVDEAGRKRIDNFLREMDCNFPGKVPQFFSLLRIK